MERRPAVLLGLSRNGLAKLRIRLRKRIQPRNQGAVVEHRAAYKQGRFLPLKDLFDDADGVEAELAGGIALVGIDEVDQVMRHACALGGGGLRCADVHAAVDLRRIDRDDFEWILLSETQGEGALAARGRPEERERRRQALAAAGDVDER